MSLKQARAEGVEYGRDVAGEWRAARGKGRLADPQADCLAWGLTVWGSIGATLRETRAFFRNENEEYEFLKGYAEGLMLPFVASTPLRRKFKFSDE